MEKEVKLDKIAYFTKPELVRARALAEKRNYNRCPEKRFIDELPENSAYPVVFSMIHEHACGLRVDPHVRCWVLVKKGERFFIDCDMEIFMNLNRFDPATVKQG